MSLDHGTLRELAGLAGYETGECYPASGKWLLRFVELVEDHLRREQPLTGALPEQIQEALQFYGRRENWQRDVVPHPGRRAGWRNAPAVLDKGSMARLALLAGGSSSTSNGW